VGIDYPVFYPVKDGYRDTLTVGGRLGETATVTIRVLDSSDRVVKEAVLSDEPAGRYAFTWTGRRPNDSLLPAGAYRVVQVIRDRHGNSLRFQARTTLSHEQLVWRTMKRLVAARNYSSSDRKVDGWVRASASRYSGGAVVHGGSTMYSYARAFYRVRIPADALKLRGLFVCAQGIATRGHRPPFVGISNWGAGKIDWVQIPSKPTQCWGIGVKSTDRALRQAYVRRGMIEGSIVSSGYYSMSYDAARVGFIVKYAKLTLVRPSGEESPDANATWDVAAQAVAQAQPAGKVPREVQPAQRRSLDDWPADDPSLDGPEVAAEG
jgi:hypothetical protein